MTRDGPAPIVVDSVDEKLKEPPPLLFDLDVAAADL